MGTDRKIAVWFSPAGGPQTELLAARSMTVQYWKKQNKSPPYLRGTKKYGVTTKLQG